jgi:ligand-binding sensor domain-containing protein/signal transduction histidine kinase
VRPAALPVCILFLLTVVAWAERLPIKIYSIGDGLTSDKVNRVVRDPRGFIWFCTFQGLSRFDGYGFRNYTTDEGLPSNVVQDLLITRKGDYWIGTARGVCRFRPAGSPRFISYRLGEGRARNAGTLLEDHNGTVWCGTGNGLFRLDPADEASHAFRLVDRGVAERPFDDQEIYSLMEDRRGSLWVGTGAGICRLLPDGRFVRYGKREGFPDKRVMRFWEDSDGSLWIASAGGLWHVVNSDPVRPLVKRVYSSKDGLATDWITSVLRLSGGRLWVGTTHGIAGIASASNARQAFLQYSRANGLSVDNINELAEDQQGNLWVGSDGGGAMKLARTGFTQYTDAHGLASVDTIAMHMTPTGDLYVTTAGAGGMKYLNRFNGRRFTAIRPAYPAAVRAFGWGWQQVALEARDGEWWIATGDGLCRFPRVTGAGQIARMPPKAVYTMRDGLGSSNIFRVFEDSNGDIWVGTIGVGSHGNSMGRWDRRTAKWQIWHDSDLTGGVPTAFASDRSGNVWIGFFNGGMACYRKDRLKFFTNAEGAPPYQVQHIYGDSAARLWVSTTGGLYRIDDPAADPLRITRFTAAQGLSSNRITGVTEDLSGRIYVATDRGVDRLDRNAASVQGTPQGLLVAVPVKHFTVADGLSRGELRSPLRDRQGNLWFAGRDGVSRFIPEPETPPSPPPVFITGLAVQGISQPISDLGATAIPDIRLHSDQRLIRVDFVGLSFAPGESLRYQYRLAGVDSGWSPPADQRTVTYANLSPGGYRFEVRAVNADGILSPQPAVMSLTILPPLWQRWWFELFVVLSAAAAAYGVHRYRVAQLLAFERMRTRIATDLHDDVGASLSHIAVLSELASSEAERLGPGFSVQLLREPLARITSVSGELIDSLSDIVWAISPRKDGARNLSQRMREFAEGVLVPRNVEFHLEAPGIGADLKLSPDVRRQVFLIFKECVNNIVRHSGSSRVECDLRMEAGELVLHLRDNGKGFDAANGSSGEGHGLFSIRRRAEEIGGKLELVAEPEQGARVVLRVPTGHHLNR